jgi:hypothetical protein
MLTGIAVVATIASCTRTVVAAEVVSTSSTVLTWVCLTFVYALTHTDTFIALAYNKTTNTH